MVLSRATFYFVAEDGSDAIVFEEEKLRHKIVATLRKAGAVARRIVPVARFLYKNRKTEIALVLSVVSVGREVVQIATGH